VGISPNQMQALLRNLLMDSLVLLSELGKAVSQAPVLAKHLIRCAYRGGAANLIAVAVAVAVASASCLWSSSCWASFWVAFTRAVCATALKGNRSLSIVSGVLCPFPTCYSNG
jgi:ABC-type multidrug transport system permease subunit